jgi:hypothetical protein
VVGANVESSYPRPGARVEHGVEVVTIMAGGSGGGSGVRSDALFGLFDIATSVLIDRF